MVLLAFVPAISSAATFEVNTTADGSGIEGQEVCTGAIGVECTLREALGKAGQDTNSPDTITFTPLTAGDKLEVSEFQLPAIYGQVTIEGDTAQGATAGVPALELEPVFFSSTVGESGFTVLGGEGTRIEGFAIGGFGIGIEVGPEEGESPIGTEICGDSLGTKLDGLTAEPNEVGVEVRRGEEEVEWPTGTVIGTGTNCAGNAISGNSGYGIVDEGRETTIAGNSIGIGPQPNGEILPNGAGGILETESAAGAMIGGVGEEAVFFGNSITNNNGPGVLVENGGSNVSIRHNYISRNEGLGIEIVNGVPAVPTLTSTYSQSRKEFWAKGTVTGTEGEEVELEFFGNVSCDPSGAGEGATYLAGGAATIGSGPTEFGFLTPVEVPRDDRAITATVTRASGATSEFSTCSAYEPPPIALTVNTLSDSAHGGCFTTCSLREAIETANESPALDTIDFGAGGEGVIALNEDLQEILEPVEIDGTSAPGYMGRPLVLLDGTDVPRGGENPISEGLIVQGKGGGSVIKGLAVGGFEYGVWLDGATGSRLCSSWIGVELDGSTALPNNVGVEAGVAAETPAEESIENEIGVGCGAGSAPNVMAGNLSWGINDLGVGTKIGGNIVGISPDGAPMGNGEVGEAVGEGGEVFGGGVQIATEASQPLVGGVGNANVIAYNDGFGVLVRSTASHAEIRANSIYGNEGKGIEILEEAPTAPIISAVTGQSGALAVSGTVTSGDDEAMELDFFASAICSPLGAGVGETYLGSKTEAVKPESTQAFGANLTAPISDDELYITVTATGTEGTTEFSECVQRPAPKHEEAAPPSNPLPPQTKVFIPKNGEKVVVKPEAGKVKIKLPGTKKYVTLTELKEIPVGAVIDATNGRVKLTSISPDGTEQTAEFFGGVFRVKQKEGSGLVVLELLDTTTCPAPTKKTSKGKSGKGTSPRAVASSVSARPKKSKTAGKLWGSGHGSFRTEGHDGSATVEGTIWLVEDRCDGTTFFRTRRGIVKVRDFVKHKSLPLPAGKTYLAGEE